MILVDRELPGITVLSLNRPEKRNALNIQMMQELCDVIEKDCKDPKQRVLILKGEGAVFCSGLDLKEVQDPSKEKESTKCVAKLIRTIATCSLVTIAIVQGAAIAGGAGIVASCDFAIAAEGSRFGFPETRIGLVAAIVMPALVRVVGYREARELLFLGELISAERAAQIGLVNRTVPAHELFEEAFEFANLTLKGAPKALMQTKKLLNELWPGDWSQEIEGASKYHHQARISGEAKEGVTAFLEKRPAVWE